MTINSVNITHYNFTQLLVKTGDADSDSGITTSRAHQYFILMRCRLCSAEVIHAVKRLRSLLHEDDDKAHKLLV